jgi:hypothetical protein
MHQEGAYLMAIKFVQIRVEPEEYKELAKKWGDAGFESVQSAGMHALRTANWGGDEDPEKEVQPRLRPYMDRLRKILSSKNDAAIEASMKVLIALSDFVRLQEAATARGKR